MPNIVEWTVNQTKMVLQWGKTKSHLTTGTEAINTMAEVRCYVLLALEVEDGFLGQRCKT